MKKYAIQLKLAGFSKSKTEYSKEIKFYKPMQDDTAFIVNLSYFGDDTLVVYGATSTAFTKMNGDEDSLRVLGVGSDEITVREKIIVRDKATEKIAKKEISEFYNQTKNLSKDKLLTLGKEKRNSFVNHFKLALKPLGFTKKALTWTKKLEDGYSLSFNLQKSAYADTYYFNVYLNADKIKNVYGSCFYNRINCNDVQEPMDWQLIDQEKLKFFIENEVVEYLNWIINTPLSELGKETKIWQGCICQRDRCDNCWVEKNLWQAKEMV